MEEIWKPIKGYKGRYEISNFGRVRSKANYHKGTLDKWKILKPTANNKGYLYVTVGKKRLVHRLVGEAFLEMDPSKKEINHIDGNPSNNRVENLEWCNRSENNIHRCRVLNHPGTEKRRIAVQCVETGEIYESKTAVINAGKAHDWTHLNLALNNPTKTCYGRHWRYA